MSSFFKLTDYPDVNALCDQIFTDFDALRRLSRSMDYIPWPEPIYRGRWDVTSLKYRGLQFSEQFEWLSDPRIRTAGFSLMFPGCAIMPHRGNAGSNWRLHLGIDCPTGDCGLKIGMDTARWKEGEFIMFQDEDLHSAWNFAETPRLILLVDIAQDATSLNTSNEPVVN